MDRIRPYSRTDRRQEVTPAPAVERRTHQLREMEVRVERKSNRHVILYLANEFVTHNLHLFGEALGRLCPLERGQQIELEMSRVPYADSEALGQILSWARKFNQAGATLTIINPTPCVTGIMEILGLDEVVPILRRHSFPSTGV